MTTNNTCACALGFTNTHCEDYVQGRLKPSSYFFSDQSNAVLLLYGYTLFILSASHSREIRRDLILISRRLLLELWDTTDLGYYSYKPRKQEPPA